MLGANRVMRSVGWASMACLLAVWGCGGTAGAAFTSGGSQSGDQADFESGDESADGTLQPEYVAFNDGGGDLASRLGGSTYSGEAAGPLASGTLTLTFASDGVLTSLGGTVLGSYFGFPIGTEVVFDYQTASVTGTYEASGVAPRSLESYLTDTGQSIDLWSVVVSMVGDSLLVLTDYSAVLTGHPAGERTISLEGTLRFQTNEDLQGGLILPDYADTQVPTFMLLRQ